MPLDFQTVPIAFTQGLDTKTQRKLVVPGKWSRLENLYLSKDGTPRRRDGMENFAAVQGNALVTRDGELVVVSGQLAQSVGAIDGSSSVPAGGAANGSIYGNVAIGADSIIANSAYHDYVDCAHGSGYTCYVWCDFAFGTTPGVARITIVDEASGTQVVSAQQVGANASRSPRVVFADGAFFIVFYDTVFGLSCAVVDAATVTLVGAPVLNIGGTLIGAVPAMPNIDACVFVDGSSVMAVGVTSIGADSIQAIRIVRAGTVPASTGVISIALQANVPRAGVCAVTCMTYGGVAGVFYIAATGGSAGTNGTAIDNTFAVSTPQTLIDATVPPVNGPCHVTAIENATAAVVFTDQQSSYGTANFRPIRCTRVSTTLAVLAGPQTTANSATFRVNAAEAAGPQGPFICGKAFSVFDSVSFTTNFFLPTCTLENYNPAGLGATCINSGAQQSFFLLDVSRSANPVGDHSAILAARALQGLVTTSQFNYLPAVPLVQTPSSVAALADGTRRISILQHSIDLQILEGFNVTPVGVTSLRLEPNYSTQMSSDQLGQTAYLGGGLFSEYDGTRFVEQGFAMFPEGIRAVVSAAGTGALTPGVHQICAVYEWTDALGNRHQSAPSPAVTVTVVNATDIITAYIPTLLLTQKRGVVIAVYMTTAAGLTFYRVYDSTFPTPNTLAAAFITTVIGSPSSTDAFISANELLYSQPNQADTSLPNLGPPPNTALGAHQNRLFTNVSDKPSEYRFSQPYAPGVGLMFNESLGGRVPVDAGEIVGIASMDEKVILFGRNKPFVVYGTGPNAAGDFSNYSEPQEVSSDVGCNAPNSILKMPMGIIFKSPKGWYLLGRDLSVKFIGDGVEAYNAFTPRSATLIGDRQECRFLLGESTVLVWSYLDTQWSVFTLPYSPNAATWWPATGRYAHVSQDATLALNQDTPGAFIDTVGPAGIPALPSWTARTAWLHLAALEGFQRARWLYFTATPNDPDALGTVLTIDVAFDDSETSPGFYTTVAHPSSLLPSQSFTVDIRHRLRRQKCKSLRFTFSEASESGEATSQCLTGIQALALEMGVKRSVNRLRAAQTVG